MSRIKSKIFFSVDFYQKNRYLRAMMVLPTQQLNQQLIIYHFISKNKNIDETKQNKTIQYKCLIKASRFNFTSYICKLFSHLQITIEWFKWSSVYESSCTQFMTLKHCPVCYILHYCIRMNKIGIYILLYTFVFARICIYIYLINVYIAMVS